MKLKNNLLMILVVSLTLLISLSVVCAQDSVDELTVKEDSISVDDTLLKQDSQEVLTSNVIYISPNGTGSGSSESNPSNWNSAVSQASNGDTIQFSNGTFNNINGNIRSSITLKGSGNTTIDAQSNGGFFTTSSGSSITLEKLSFINAYTGDKQGNPDGPKTGFDGEGGIVNNGNLIVKECYFASNQGIGTEGGAIHNSGTCYVYDSIFYGNGGKKGGAIYSDKNSRLYMYNSLVNRCVSREGSAVHAKEAYVEIHNCSVVNASAKNGLFYVKKSNVYFYDSYFYNSKAVDAAGVINIDKESTVLIDNCTFDKISSTGTKLWFHDEYGSGDGGAIVVEDSARNVEIRNSVFSNCAAKGYGGAIYIQSSAEITIDNCSFIGNNAPYGYNIYSTRYASRLTITNSTFEIKSKIKTNDIPFSETENVNVEVDDGTNNLLNPTYALSVDGKSNYTVSGQSVAINGLSNGTYEVKLMASDANSNVYIFTNESSQFVVGNKNETQPQNTTPGNSTSGNNTSGNVTPENETSKLASIINVTVFENGQLSGILSDVNGKGIANADIKYSVEGNQNTLKTDNDGKFTISDASGTVILTFEGNDNYLASNYTISIEKPIKSRLATQFNVTGGLSYTQYAIEYSSGERGQNFTVQLLDINGKPLVNKEILVGYNGKILYRTTDATGHASVQINLRDANRLTFAVTYLGSEEYDATMTVYLITIVKKPVTITAGAKTFKASAKTKKYTVSLKTITGASADGKTYFKAGKKVTLKINGKTYSAKTNDKGQVTFNLKLTKKGTFTAAIKYAGDTTYNAVSKNVKIKIK